MHSMCIVNYPVEVATIHMGGCVINNKPAIKQLNIYYIQYKLTYIYYIIIVNALSLTTKTLNRFTTWIGKLGFA